MPTWLRFCSLAQKCRHMVQRGCRCGGPILGNMNRTNDQEKLLRISNLSRYLETIQAR